MNKLAYYKYKCRSCLGESKRMESLEMLASAENPLSLAELLKEVVNVNVSDTYVFLVKNISNLSYAKGN